MKIAVAGKGGTGKTTAISLLATYLAKKSKVLAFDVDTNENLAYSLGFSNKELLKLNKIRNHIDFIFDYTKTDKDWRKRKYTPNKNANYFVFGDQEISDFINKITINKNNIYVGHLGNVDEDKRGIENMCDSFTLMRIFLNHLNIDDNSHLLVDLAAGNDLITRSTIINMDTILLVVEPTSKNLTVAKDLLISLRKINFNKVTVLVNKSFEEEDKSLVSKTLKIEEENIIRFPFSREIIELDNENSLNFDKTSINLQREIVKLVSLLKKNRSNVDLLSVTKDLDERTKIFHET